MACGLSCSVCRFKDLLVLDPPAFRLLMMDVVLDSTLSDLPDSFCGLFAWVCPSIARGSGNVRKMAGLGFELEDGEGPDWTQT